MLVSLRASQKFPNRMFKFQLSVIVSLSLLQIFVLDSFFDSGISFADYAINSGFPITYLAYSES